MNGSRDIVCIIEPESNSVTPKAVQVLPYGGESTSFPFDGQYFGDGIS